MQPTAPEVVAERADRFRAWVGNVSRPQPQGHGFVYTPARSLGWTPLRKPLRECTVALVTTAGLHLKRREPFAVYAEAGDWTSRCIPGDVDTRDLTFTHTHYDTRDALRDPNVVFPLDRLRELAAVGMIGGVAPRHFGFMGFIPDPRHLVQETAPEAAATLAADEVDVALLTAG